MHKSGLLASQVHCVVIKTDAGQNPVHLHKIKKNVKDFSRK